MLFRSGVGPALLVENACVDCAEMLPSTPLPGTITHGAVEVAVGTHRLDVGLYSNADIVAGVEIFAAHRVPEEKWSSALVPIAELSADDVLESPHRWRPIRTSRPRQCRSCREASELKRAKTDRLARVGRSTGQPVLQAAPWHTAVRQCFKCRKDTLVYHWDGREEWENRRPPSGSPPTVKLRYSKQVQKIGRAHV